MVKLLSFGLFLLLLVSASLYSKLNTHSKMLSEDSTITNNEILILGSFKHSSKSLRTYYLIDKYSSIYKIPKKIAFNIAFKETTFRGPFDWKYNPHQSSCCAHGPMQITVSTSNMINGDKSSESKLKNNLEYNIKTSMKLLNKLYNEYNDWEKVCGAYNTGQPIINKYAKFCYNNNYEKNWVNYDEFKK